jgi:hypothetical protein
MRGSFWLFFWALLGVLRLGFGVRGFGFGTRGMGMGMGRIDMRESKEGAAVFCVCRIVML